MKRAGFGWPAVSPVLQATVPQGPRADKQEYKVEGKIFKYRREGAGKTK